MSRRIRRTPFIDKVEQHGVRRFSVVNHMLLPKAFQSSLEEDYWHLREHVQIWDVACQRQVEIKGPDAARLTQWMTPRDISNTKAGDCIYVPLVDENGGLINDPVLLKLADDHIWLSIADSDVLLWAKGLAIGSGMDVTIEEPDVSPLAIQGPKAEDLMVKVFGSAIQEIGFFKFSWFDFNGTKQLVSRSGYSKQGGFEIYLRDGSLGSALWDTIWEAGEEHNIAPGCPNLIERIEGGLHSYGNEFNRENNPLECGFDSCCRLDGSIDFVGLSALQKIQAHGIKQKLRGILFDGDPCPPCGKPWPVTVDDVQVGQITSAAYSPRLERNVGQSMISKGYWNVGQSVVIHSIDGIKRSGRVTGFPIQ